MHCWVKMLKWECGEPYNQQREAEEFFCTLIFHKDFRMEEDDIDTEPPPSYATVTQEILLKSII